MHLEDELLYQNFKGEPWAIPRGKLQYKKTPVRLSSTDHVGFLKEMKPMLLVIKFVGVLPLRFESNEEVKFKCLSLTTLYCLLVQSIIVAATVVTYKMRIERTGRPGHSFNDMVLEVGCLLCFLPSFLAPINHLPEIRKKVQFLNQWNSFQTHFRRVTGHALPLRLGRRVKQSLATSCVLTTIFTSLLILLQRDFTWWQAVIFAYCTLLNTVIIGFWVVTNEAFIITAGHIEHSLREHVASANACKVADYDQLWRELSKQTQDLGNAFGYTYGGQVVMHFILQLVGIFGFISQVQHGNFFNTSGFLSTALIFSWLTYVFCNAAERATQIIGPQFQESLRTIFQSCVNSDTETKYELRIFLEDITAYPPAINLCGFVQVNRSLQTSLVSSIVTYLVVLAQIQLSAN